MKFASRMLQLRPSAVREILKVAERPDVLSFAGGLPAPELFPVEALARAHQRVFEREPGKALQYGVTEGHGPLKTWIAERMRGRGIVTSPETLLITNGSQQGIDLVARVLLEPGDTVLVENPTYLAALQVFAASQARVVPLGDDFEASVREHAPKLIYLVSDFGNPSGACWPLADRLSLLAAAARHGVPVLEDDPYSELRFAGDALPPLAALDTHGVVIYLSTFSKTLAPGMRLGWLHGPVELVRAATVAKQPADLHTSTLSQRAAAALFEDFDFDAHLTRIRVAYSERCEAMERALRRYLPQARWRTPEGGLFFWVRLPEGVNDDALFLRAVEQKVAFVPGNAFFVGPERHGFIRLNFSNRPPELIDEGLRRLGAAAAE